MAFPTALTSNSDVLKYIFEQGITRILESGNDFTELHQGVTIEIKNWIESRGGIADADDIENPEIYEPAAAHFFIAKLLRPRDPGLAERYGQLAVALLRQTSPRLSSDAEDGGTVANVVVIKQGTSRPYTTRRTGAIFARHRNDTSRG